MSGVRAGRVKKSRKSPRAQTRSVLRMMAIMQDNNKESVPEKEFLETGRTGRRNAMHDILQPAGAVVTTADLPSRLSKLATSDIPQPGTSKTDLEVKTDEKSSNKEECS